MEKKEGDYLGIFHPSDQAGSRSVETEEGSYLEVFLPSDLAGTFANLQSPRFGGNYFNHVTNTQGAQASSTHRNILS